MQFGNLYLRNEVWENAKTITLDDFTISAKLSYEQWRWKWLETIDQVSKSVEWRKCKCWR